MKVPEPEVRMGKLNSASFFRVKNILLIYFPQGQSCIL